MLTEEKVRDAASAQLLKGEHEAVKAEIEAREGTFQTVADLGEALVQGGHFAANVSVYTWVWVKIIPNPDKSQSRQFKILAIFTYYIYYSKLN